MGQSWLLTKVCTTKEKGIDSRSVSVESLIWTDDQFELEQAVRVWDVHPARLWEVHLADVFGNPKLGGRGSGPRPRGSSSLVTPTTGTTFLVFERKQLEHFVCLMGCTLP